MTEHASEEVLLYLDKLPEPERSAALPLASGFEGPSQSLNMAAEWCRKRGLRYDGGPDLREHSWRGLAAVAAGSQRGTHRKATGLDKIILEGLEKDEHWDRAHAHLRSHGHPFEYEAVLAWDTSAAADKCVSLGTGLRSWRLGIAARCKVAALRLAPLDEWLVNASKHSSC